jgi:hypothetical protein
MRWINRFASGLLGLALIALGLLVVLETALIAAGRRPVWLPLDRWYSWLMRTTPASGAFLATAIVVGVVGLLILLVELRRWRPDRLLAAGTAAMPWWVSRRTVERRTATMAAAVAGVNKAHAQARGKPRRWHLRLEAEGYSDKRDAVNRAVRQELARLDIDDRTDVKIVLREPSRRVA